jgi:hypothetical protein
MMYLLVLVAAIVSAIGYRAYSKCLSCLAYRGGGPVGSVEMSVASFSDHRPAEANPLVQPFSKGRLRVTWLGYAGV